MKNIFFYGCSGFFKEQFVWVKDFLSSNKNQYTLAGIIDDPKSIYLKKQLASLIAFLNYRRNDFI